MEKAKQKASTKPKGKSKLAKALLWFFSAVGIGATLVASTAGITYAVKPYQVDFSWQQTQTETDNTTESE